MSRLSGKLSTVNLIVRVVFMFRLVYMKRCWRIWCVVCWKTVLIFRLLIVLSIFFCYWMNWSSIRLLL